MGTRKAGCKHIYKVCMMPYDDLMNLLRSRRSVREFTTEPVNRDDVVRLIEAARWAPSNHNRQPWKFLVYDNRDEIRALAGRVEQHLAARLKALPAVAASHADTLLKYATFFRDAPVLIVATHKRPVGLSASLLEGLPNPALVSGEPISVAMAVQNILLAAHALGLGACVLTGPLLVTRTLEEAIPLPDGSDLNCLIAVGHAARTPDAPRRKELAHLVEFRNPAGTFLSS
jgi:nitroreductase